MARTTLAIDDALLRAPDARGARGQAMQDVVNETLRRGLRHDPGRRTEMKVHTSRGGLPPGVDVCDRDRMLDVLDDRGP